MIDAVSPNAGAYVPAPAGEPSKHARIQVPLGFIAFQCWKLDREWRRLDAATRKAHVAEFVRICDEGAKGLKHFAAFSTAGLKNDVDLILWAKATRLEDLNTFAVKQRTAEMTRWMDLSHNYMAMLKGSPYEDESKIFKPQAFYKFLFLYPFVKTRPWYLLPLAERMRIMKGHIESAAAYPMVRINTSYSFGIDDQDFVVAFETDEADSFVNLVQQLRETESSLYTQRDT
ncbi:MAG: chlorite dismutase family protein, partial [bacterium]